MEDEMSSERSTTLETLPHREKLRNEFLIYSVKQETDKKEA